MTRGMRWDSATAREVVRRTTEPPPIDGRFKPPTPGTILLMFEYGDGLSLGYAEDEHGIFMVRYDRARRQWTSRMQDWMVDRLDTSAADALIELAA